MEIFEIRPYNNDPYLVFPNAKPFKIKIGNLSPSLRVLVHQRGNLFGDALPLELAGLDITFRLYNSNGILVASGTVLVSNTDTAEIEYSWGQFDLKETGVFSGEFIFRDIDDSTFVLPSRDRIQIIVF